MYLLLLFGVPEAISFGAILFLIGIGHLGYLYRYQRLQSKTMFPKDFAEAFASYLAAIRKTRRTPFFYREKMHELCGYTYRHMHEQLQDITTFLPAKNDKHTSFSDQYHFVESKLMEFHDEEGVLIDRWFQTMRYLGIDHRAFEKIRDHGERLVVEHCKQLIMHSPILELERFLNQIVACEDKDALSRFIWPHACYIVPVLASSYSTLIAEKISEACEAAVSQRGSLEDQYTKLLELQQLQLFWYRELARTKPMEEVRKHLSEKIRMVKQRMVQQYAP